MIPTKSFNKTVRDITGTFRTLCFSIPVYNGISKFLCCLIKYNDLAIYV